MKAGKVSSGRKRSGQLPPSPPLGPPDLSPVARKLDQAFHEIAAGDVTVREVEIPVPKQYQPSDVRSTREKLGVSVTVFAELVGVPAKLVDQWEQGHRAPSPLACRLLERINADPDRFLADLLKTRKVAG